MGIFLLTAVRLNTTGRNRKKFMLMIGPNTYPEPNPAPTWERAYATIDELCVVINVCQVLETGTLEALCRTLGRGEIYSAHISPEQVWCIGLNI